MANNAVRIDLIWGWGRIGPISALRRPGCACALPDEHHTYAQFSQKKLGLPVAFLVQMRGFRKIAEKTERLHAQNCAKGVHSGGQYAIFPKSRPAGRDLGWPDK